MNRNSKILQCVTVVAVAIVAGAGAGAGAGICTVSCCWTRTLCSYLTTGTTTTGSSRSNLGITFALAFSTTSNIPFGYLPEWRKNSDSSRNRNIPLNAAMRRPPGDLLDYNFLRVHDAGDGDEEEEENEEEDIDKANSDRKNRNITNNQDHEVEVEVEVDDTRSSTLISEKENFDIITANSNVGIDGKSSESDNSSHSSTKSNFLQLPEMNFPTNLPNMNFKMQMPNVTLGTGLMPKSNNNNNTTFTAVMDNSTDINNNINNTINVLRGVVQMPKVSLPNMNMNMSMNMDMNMNMPPLPNMKNISLPSLNVSSVNVSLPDGTFRNSVNNMKMMKIPDLPNLSDLPDLPEMNMKLPQRTRKYDKQSQIKDGINNNGAGAGAAAGGNGIPIIDVNATDDEEYNNKIRNNNNNMNPLLLFGVFQELQLELDVTKYKFPSWKQQQEEQPPIDVQQATNIGKTEDNNSARAEKSTTTINGKKMMIFSKEKGNIQSQSRQQELSTPPPPPSNLLLNALTTSICKVTGKDTYQFGDLTRYIDSKAKLAVQGIQNDIRDLSVQVDDAIQGKITSLSMMQVQKEFSITDVSRTLVKKVASGDYQLSDITFLCKILIALGVADFTPVAGILPVRLLIELFGYSTAIDLGERFATALIKELDKRLQMNEEEGGGGGGKDVALEKQLLKANNNNVEEQRRCDDTGDSTRQKLDKRLQIDEEEARGTVGRENEQSSYEAGDLTRQAILDYIGKDSYEVGDVVSKEGSSSKDSVDVLKELEECLAMERKLIEKLNKIKA